MLFSTAYMLVIAKMSVVTYAIIVSLILRISVGENPGDARITEWVNERFPDGSYYFRFQTSSGITRNERGTLVGEKDKAILKVKGYYSYPNGDGTFVSKSYEADENGYRTPVDHGVGYAARAEAAPNPMPIPTLVYITMTGGGLGG